jgi:hypothetical protein
MENVFSSYALEAGIHLINCTSSIKNSYLGENEVGLRISGEKQPILENNTYNGNKKDIYWPNSGDSCENLKLSSSELEIECRCCPY